MNPVQRAWADLKALVFPGAGGGGGGGGVHVWTEPYRYAWADGLLSRLLTPHTDYASEVGDGRANGIVQAALGWICRAFPEAPAVVLDQDDQEVERHPLTALLRRPNPYYSGALLWSATIADRALTGNAYWLKARSGSGQVVELWYTPAHLIAPRWPENGSEFITHYEYAPNGTPMRVEVADVVHFRYGIDPQNPRLGRSPLAAVLGEVYTDQEAARFTGALLKNMGVPGVILSPSDKEVELSPSEAEQLRDRFDQRFGGAGRGRTMVMMGPTKVDLLSFSPEQLDLKALRMIPETRISAALGVPAIVAGLASGLDRSCVPAYARVQTPTGTKTVGEIQAGMTVWSFKDGAIVPRMVTHKWAAGRDIVYEVRTKNRRIRATDNHPFLVRVPGRMGGGGNDTRQPSYEWRDLGDLKVGDHIIYAKSYPDQGETRLPDGRPATTEALQFFGAIIGDGTVTPGVGVRMAMPPADRCVGAYREMATSLFTRQAQQSGGSVAVQQSVQRAPIMLQQRERDFGFSSAEGSRWLATLGLSGRAHTKRVPSWVYPLRRDLRLAFLAGVVDTDGHIDQRGALTITFCNSDLVNDVRDLMISLGIHCSNISHQIVPGANLPNTGVRETYASWRFTASSAVQIAEIPFVDPLYRERVQANPDRHKAEGFDAHKAGLSPDLGFGQIKEIVAIGEEDVFDLTVEDGHSFFCENALISNTFANFSEAREAAYEENIIPTQRLVADELTIQLLPDFGDATRQRVAFDYSRVRVLAEDQNELARRYTVMLRAGAITVAEYRTALGLETTPEHDVYYVPNTNTRVPAGELADLAAPAPVLPPRPSLALPEGETPAEPPEEGVFEETAAPKGFWPVTALSGAQKAITIAGADEAERLYEARRRQLGLANARA